LGGLAIVLMRNVQRTERLQFLAAVADHLLKRLVRCREMILLVKDGDADRGCFEHAAPPLLTGTERCFGIPPPNHFFLKVCGAGGDPPLKFRIGVVQGGFSALPLTNFCAKKPVGPLECAVLGSDSASGITFQIATPVPIESSAVTALMPPSIR
jgi:hypothetical protein